MSRFRLVLAAGWLLAASGPGAAQERVLRVTTPMSPPAWALLEREILRASSEACGEFYRRYLQAFPGAQITDVSPRLCAAVWQSPATGGPYHQPTEYLGLVAWSVHGRHAALSSRLGALNFLAPRWGLAMGIFVLILGCGGWLLDQVLADPVETSILGCAG